MQSQRWKSDAPSACISRQARWWSSAQRELPSGAPRSVWDTRWNAQTMQLAIGEERRYLLLKREGAGGWRATQWHWNPNPRPPTRRWQEGRWKLLLESGARYHSANPEAGTGAASRLHAVLRGVLGARAGEFHPEGLALESEGVCMQVGNPLPGRPTLALSYSPNDSRLEQRAAMHLQLARQYPHAKWVTNFKMLALPEKLPSGAKFLATWVEENELRSQLWIPGKGGAATVRIRMSAPLPRGQGPEGDFVARAKPLVERELEAIAVQWALAYE